MPTQDYCPNCNTLLAIPDGVAEVICPNCQILLEFDPAGIDIDPSTAPTEPYQEYGDDIFTQPPPKEPRKKTKTGKVLSRGKQGKKKRPTTTYSSRKIKLNTSTPVDENEPTHSSRKVRLNTNTPTERRSGRKTKGAKTDSRPIPPEPPKVAPPEPKLNFVSDEDNKKTDSGGIPRDLSNIKMAKPVDVDNITGLITPLVTAQPVEPEQPPASETKTDVMDSGFVKIVGSSTEFRLDKDAATPPPPAPAQADEELKRMAAKAQEEAQRAKLELEQAKRLAEEERRRLESEKQALQARQEAEEAHRAEQESRRMAEEAQRQAEAMRQQLAQQEELQRQQLAQQEELQRQQLAQQEEVQRQQAEAKRQKEDALAKAKEAAIAKAKERLIAEKKKKLIEEAKRKKAAETGTLPPATAPSNSVQPGSSKASRSDISKQLRRKKKKFGAKQSTKKFRGSSDEK